MRTLRVLLLVAVTAGGLGSRASPSSAQADPGVPPPPEVLYAKEAAPVAGETMQECVNRFAAIERAATKTYQDTKSRVIAADPIWHWYVGFEAWYAKAIKSCQGRSATKGPSPRSAGHTNTVDPTTKQTLATASRNLQAKAAAFTNLGDAACLGSGIGGVRNSFAKTGEAIVKREAKKIAVGSASIQLKQAAAARMTSLMKGGATQRQLAAQAKAIAKAQQKLKKSLVVAKEASHAANKAALSEYYKVVKEEAADKLIEEGMKAAIDSDPYSVPTSPCGFAFSAGSGWMLIIALGFNALANDPPDANYSEVATPDLHTPLALEGRGDLSSETARLLDNEINIGALGRALLTSVERDKAHRRAATRTPSNDSGQRGACTPGSWPRISSSRSISDTRSWRDYAMQVQSPSPHPPRPSTRSSYCA